MALAAHMAPHGPSLLYRYHHHATAINVNTSYFRQRRCGYFWGYLSAT